MAETFTPDNLVISGLPQITEDKTLKVSAGALVRGTVMGKITKGAVAAAVAAGGGTAGANTGAGTCVIDATTPLLAGGKPGTYHVQFTAATAFYVIGPDGNVIGSAAALGTFAKQIKFVLANSGTAHVAGDGWDIAVAAGSGQIAAYDSTAIDGTEEPDSILLEDVADVAATQAALVALSGEFSSGALVFAHSGDTAAAIKDKLRDKNIYIKDTRAVA
jgi:hypothetical protein